MRTLITGGAGFVGAHLVRRCLAAGDSVSVLLRPSTDAWRLHEINGRINLHRANLNDRVEIEAWLANTRPERVFHLASDTGSRHDKALTAARSVGDIADLITLLTAAAEADEPPRIVVRAGSIAEYGIVPVPFREDQRERPGNGYAATLVAGTHFAQAMARALPFRLITARLALVYGPDQAEDFLVPSLVSALALHRPVTLHRPLDRRDLIHVEDAVTALLLLSEADAASTGEIYNIGSGASVGVAEIAYRVAALADADPALIDATPHDDPVTLQLSTARSDDLIGTRPAIDLDAGLAALVAAERAIRIGVMA